MIDPMHSYEVHPRKDRRGVDLVSDALPFGRLWYGEPNAVPNAIYCLEKRAGTGAGKATETFLLLVFTGLEYVEAMRNRTEQLGLFEALSDELFGERKQPDGNVPVPAQDVYEIRHRKNRDGFDRSAIGCETTQSGVQGHSDGTIYKDAIGKVYTTSSRQARITQF